MKIKNKIFYLTFFLITLFMLFNVKSYAGTQKWNALDYNATVNEDGSMDVVETWDIKISETNTLFKNFKLDSSKYSGITNVKVARTENNEELFLTQIFEEQYHVDPGCYYALKTDYSTFEIAWNVGLDNSSDVRTYKIYYTIEDAVKIYNDCTELYWQFLGTQNAIPGKNITGSIHLPQKVSNIEKLRVWAHGELTGNIERTDNNLVTFSVVSIPSNSLLEVRVVTEENIYEESTNIINKNKLQSILDEEQKWADDTNAKIALYRSFIFGIIIINILIVIFFLSKIKKYIKNGKELEKEFAYSIPEIEYFREIPNENEATPARASYMYEFRYNKSYINQSISKIFAGTILDLSLKGYLKFEPINEKEVKIILIENNNPVGLSEDENIILNILEKAMENREYITTKDFAQYAKDNYDEVYKELNKINNVIDEYEEKSGNIDEERRVVSEKLIKKRGLYIMLLCISFFVMPFFTLIFTIYIGIIACIVVISRNIKKVTTLSEKGYIEKMQWEGLKKYMEDYSLLKEKGVPDIVLWEKFLVYATTFGISKKVIQQLKVVHPEMFNIDSSQSVGDMYMRYAYWNMVCDSRFNDNYFDNFSSSLEKVYTSAVSAYNIANSSSSSGSGGGGGFSSGGGDGGRRWRLRWTLKS